jgi:DNA-directed RNA polymerase specialized sigma24 family protein
VLSAAKRSRCADGVAGWSMVVDNNAREVKREECCNRWKKDVFAFCRLLVGDGATAEEVTCEALVTFCRGREVGVSDREIPPRLVGLAFRATEKYGSGSSQPLQVASRLESAIQRLPRPERAAVIMRNLLRMDWESMALATDLSRTQAHEVWARGIVQLNELLQRDVPKEGQ